MKRTLLVALGLGLLTMGCGQPPESSPTPMKTDSSPATTSSPATETSPGPDSSASPTSAAPVAPAKGEMGKEKGPGGMTYTIVTKGDEKRTVAKGDNVRAHYTGWLTDGTKFDSSLDRGQPFEVVIGAGNVIPGWDEGIPGMKVGETRRLYIPSKMGYGEAGTPGGPIPPNADLVFEVSVLDAGKGGGTDTLDQ